MSTICELFSMAAVRHEGVVRWGDPVPSNNPGIYIVSLSPDPERNDCPLSSAPIDCAKVASWLSRATGLTIDNEPNSRPKVLAQRLRKYWLADETILYIGQTSQPLRKRVRQYYRHRLGARGPHKGGQWIKTLSVLDELFVHHAESPDHVSVEFQLIEAFVSRVSAATKAQVGSDDYAFPFANLELRDPKHGNRIRKRHGIGRSTC